MPKEKHPIPARVGNGVRNPLNQVAIAVSTAELYCSR